MKIYEKSSVKHFDPDDTKLEEARFLEYPRTKSDGLNHKIFMPLDNNLTDLYSFVHELGHIFDLVFGLVLTKK